MAQDLQQLTPQRKALIGTAGVFVLLVLFTLAGYWAGGRQTNTDGANQNAAAATNQAADTGTTKAPTYVGKITKLSAEQIELLQSTNGEDTTVTISLTDQTTFRKLDYRKVPKNGLGDGAPINAGDLKVGNDVVVATANATTSPYPATRVSMVIYP